MTRYQTTMLGWRDLVGCSARTEAYFEADGGEKRVKI